ncbi:MAG: GLUG motif-containing protein, partial [Candidatus Syntrophosphaera sp.]
MNHDNMRVNGNGTLGAASGGIYDAGRINAMIKGLGYIPVSTSQELFQLRKTARQFFGKGTPYAGIYLSGLDKKYIQLAEISLREFGAGFNGGRGWTPLGSYLKKDPFIGVYDGNGLAITDLWGDNRDGIPDNRGDGLFGCASGAELRNIRIVEAYIRGNFNSGLILGIDLAGGKPLNISGCSCSGMVIGEACNSGIAIGSLSANSHSIRSVHARGRVAVNYDAVGGFIGSIAGGDIERCSATGKATSSEGFAGGFAGKVMGRVKISDSHAGVDVAAKHPYYNCGGFIGDAVSNFLTVVNCYARGSVVGPEKKTGGFLGRVYPFQV